VRAIQEEEHQAPAILVQVHPVLVQPDLPPPQVLVSPAMVHLMQTLAPPATATLLRQLNSKAMLALLARRPVSLLSLLLPLASLC